MPGLSLRGALSDEAISVFGQRLLRGVHPEPERRARNDTVPVRLRWQVCPIILLLRLIRLLRCLLLVCKSALLLFEFFASLIGVS